MVLFNATLRRLALAFRLGRFFTTVGLPAVAAVLLAAIAGALQAQVADAGTSTVTTLNDGGPGSLRELIGAANAAGTPTTINFNPAFNGTIVLTSTLPAINNDITIDGAGHAIVVSGNDTHRVLTVNAGHSLNLQFIHRRQHVRG